MAQGKRPIEQEKYTEAQRYSVGYKVAMLGCGLGSLLSLLAFGLSQFDFNPLLWLCLGAGALPLLWAGLYHSTEIFQNQWFQRIRNEHKETQRQALFASLCPWPVLRFDRYGQLISNNSQAKTYFYSDHQNQNFRCIFDFFPEISKNEWQQLFETDQPYSIEQDRYGFWVCFYFRAHSKMGVVNVYGYDITLYKRTMKNYRLSEESIEKAFAQRKYIYKEMLNELQKPLRSLNASLKNQKIHNTTKEFFRVIYEFTKITHSEFRIWKKSPRYIKFTKS